MMTSKEAFETWDEANRGLPTQTRRGAWQAATYAAQAEIDRLQAQLVRQQKSYEAEIKVEIDAALERAAVKCDEIKAVYTARYVAARAKTPNNLDFLDGASDGAEECAEAIRELKESKE